MDRGRDSCCLPLLVEKERKTETAAPDSQIVGEITVATSWIQSERTRTYSKKIFLSQLKRSTEQAENLQGV
jgi:hypothetical protein